MSQPQPQADAAAAETQDDFTPPGVEELDALNVNEDVDTINVRRGNWRAQGEVKWVFDPPPSERDPRPIMQLGFDNQIVDDNRDRKLEADLDSGTKRMGRHASSSTYMLRLVIVMMMIALGGGGYLVYESQTRVTWNPTNPTNEADDDEPSREEEADQQKRDALETLLESGEFEYQLDHESHSIYLGRLATGVHETQANAFVQFQMLEGVTWTIIDLRHTEPPVEDDISSPTPSVPAGHSIVSDEELRILRDCRRLLQRWQQDVPGSLHRRMYDNERRDRDAALAGRLE